MPIIEGSRLGASAHRGVLYVDQGAGNLVSSFFVFENG
jgi:hypothetical protein